MATPSIVQRQLAEAEALAQSMQPQAQTAVVTDASQLLTQAAPAAPTPQPPAPPAPAPTPPAENWEQRFRTLKGMYDAEMPQLRTKVATYESQMTTLQQQVQALQAQAIQAKPAETAKPSTDPRDVAAFGEDMIEMVQRYAQQTYASIRNEFADHAQKLETRLRAVEETVNGVSRKADTSMETQFYASLRQMVPDYETINMGQDWLSWLAESDPVYRVPRQVALDAAFGRFDTEGVAAVFNAFKASRPANPSAALASQVSPGSSGGAQAPTVQPAKQMLSQKFVQTFFSDQAKGRYRGREDEAARIESEINQAAAEGRIV